MYSQDVHAGIFRLSAELRAPLIQARAESARIVAKSKKLVTEITCVSSRRAAPRLTSEVAPPANLARIWHTPVSRSEQAVQSAPVRAFDVGIRLAPRA